MEKWLKELPTENEFYESIQQILPPYMIENAGLVPNPIFWNKLIELAFNFSSRFSALPTQNKCSNKINESTTYPQGSAETSLLFLGLISLSWFKENLARKIINGHCNNPVHGPSPQKPANCDIGRQFHDELSDDFLKIQENFLMNMRQFSRDSSSLEGNGEDLNTIE